MTVFTKFEKEDDVISLPDVAEPPPYAQEFLEFIDEATSVYHSCALFARKLEEAGYEYIKEADDWPSLLQPGGKYYIRRTPSIVAFAIPSNYSAPGPFTISAAHLDAVCLKVKPHSIKDPKGGWERIGVAQYSGGGASQRWDGAFSTWWDRDLGCAGRVFVKGESGKVEEKLVQLPYPIASIPTLAVHFGEAAKGPFNYETNMVPVIGLTSADASKKGGQEEVKTYMSSHHSTRLLSALASTLGKGVSASDILDFELELYGYQPSTFVGLDGEMIAAPRMDDKLCSFAATMAFINTTSSQKIMDSCSDVKILALFDNEEIGSGLRQGAKSNLLQTVIERVVECFNDDKTTTINAVGQSIAKSFMLSADVTHAYNPNFDGIYLDGASPIINKGPAIYMDPNGHMTSNAWSATLLRLISEKVGSKGGELQLLYPRSDSRTGGTVGPMLSERLGVRAIDMGIPMLSMHSIRAITGSKDVGFAVGLWEGIYKYAVKLMEDIKGV